MKKSGSIKFKAKKISLEKAEELQEMDLVKNIFYQDSAGERYGGFKKLSDVLGKGKIFLSGKNNALYELKI